MSTSRLIIVNDGEEYIFISGRSGVHHDPSINIMIVDDDDKNQHIQTDLRPL